VAEQELDLIQFTAGKVAQPGAGTTQVVRDASGLADRPKHGRSAGDGRAELALLAEEIAGDAESRRYNSCHFRIA
jgi:hypothetical protein